MIMKRKLIYCVILTPIMTLLILFCVLLVDNYSIKEKVYYISQAEIYIKTIVKGSDKFGYILLSRNKNLKLSNSIDYIKINKNIGKSFLVNPYADSIIYLCDQIIYDYKGNYKEINKAIFINQVNYRIIDGINETDTIFFKKRHLTNPIDIKFPYIEVSIGEYLENVVMKRAGESSYSWVNEIKQ